MELTRKEVLAKLDKLELRCAGCKLCPIARSYTEERRDWCKANCEVPRKMQAIGVLLDEIALYEAAERACQKRQALKKQKSLDAGTSRLVAL